MSDEEREEQEQSDEGSEHTSDDTPVEGDPGEEGLGTQSGGIEGGSKAEPNETDRPQ